jgi:hypothetical protein
MTAAVSPIAITNAAVRNLVPLAGILFLGWSAAAVLILYFVDTLLSMGVMFAGLMRRFLPPPKDEGWAARLNAETGYIGGALFLCAVMAVPLGVPLVFILAGTHLDWKALFVDRGFVTGLAMQAAAAFWSGRDLYRALEARTPEELRLKRRFALVFLRWIAVIMFSYFGIVYLLGRFAPLFFVAIYAAATFMIEVAPDRFLRIMPGGAEDAEPAAAAPAARTHSTKRSRRRAR